MKKLISLLLTLVLACSLAIPAAAYADIPADSPLASEVQRAIDAGLMKGYSGDRFGYSDTMTRIQFVTVLARMDTRNQREQTTSDYITPDMAVDQDALRARSPEFLSALNSAARYDIVDRTVPFRPDAPITRREMSEMLVRFLGLKSAAQLAEKSATLPFTDVTTGKGYISVAYDIGMTRGTSPTTFAPDATATRGQAAAMLLRIHEKQTQKTTFTHGFYAISSYPQLDLALNLDAVSAGWSQMTWDGSTALLATTSANNNDFSVPSGYETVANALEGHRVPLHLNVYMDTTGHAADLLASPEGRQQAVEEIENELTVSYKALGRNPYDGVTIDFEGLRSSQEADFTAFLQELSETVHNLGKSLYVCVAPVLATGSYYDGYDYAAIGALADKVILMAYDYDTLDMSQFVGTEYYKTAATAPIDQVYWSLKIAAEKIDPAKLLLGFSCKNTAWQIDENGKLLSPKPFHPNMETVAKRLAQQDTTWGWSNKYQQSYAIYTGDDGSRYFLWYQSDDSVNAAMNAAKLLGITGTSLWRLGELPQYQFTRTDWNWAPVL